MPRYYMHLDGAFPWLDEDGEIYASLDCARFDAVRFLAEILGDRAKEIRPGDCLSVRLLDDEKQPLLQLKTSLISLKHSTFRPS